MIKSKKLSKFKDVTHGFFNKLNVKSKPKKIFFLKQTHSNKFYFVDKDSKYKEKNQGDALITNTKNLPIEFLSINLLTLK